MMELDMTTALMAVAGGAALVALVNRAIALYWRRKASAAFFVVGQRGKTPEEREWGYRNAMLAGHKKLEKFYYYATLRKFNEEKPLTVFTTEICGKDVPCVFVDYYIPSRDMVYGSEEQKEFCQRIYRFKDGKDPCIDLLTAALDVLGYTKEITLIFMPCSNSERYRMRFGRVAMELEKQGMRVLLYSMTYLFGRESRHTARDRSSIDTDVHIVSSPNVVGRTVILIDDVMTTGASVKQHSEEIALYGVKVAGVVCLGRTVRYPGNEAIWKQARRDGSWLDSIYGNPS